MSLLRGQIQYRPERRHTSVLPHVRRVAEGGRMNPDEEPIVTLTFPKEYCIDTNFKGRPMVKIYTGMTAQELIIMLLRHAATGESIAAVLKVEE